MAAAVVGVTATATAAAGEAIRLSMEVGMAVADTAAAVVVAVAPGSSAVLPRLRQAEVVVLVDGSPPQHGVARRRLLLPRADRLVLPRRRLAAITMCRRRNGDRPRLLRPINGFLRRLAVAFLLLLICSLLFP
jgi:hypothetical protein